VLNEFFYNDKGKLPSFIESVDDFPHLKIVKLRGPIDGMTVPKVQFFLKKAQKNPMVLNKSVLLDLRKVTHVDTIAIAGILKVLSTLTQKKYKLGLVNAPEALRSQLAILRLDKIVTVFESWEKALLEIHTWNKEWE